jgi:zinc transport system substrate-binding protein
MAENIYHGLVEIDPEGESYYSSNLNSYFSRLDAAHQQALTDFVQIQNRVFMMLHPAMAYYARDYSLTQIAIEYEGKDPSPADLASLIEQARQFGVKVIFISPQFNPDSARVIADEIGGTVTFIDGLDRDYLANMIEITNLMIEAMAHDQG